MRRPTRQPTTDDILAMVAVAFIAVIALAVLLSL